MELAADSSLRNEPISGNYRDQKCRCHLSKVRADRGLNQPVVALSSGRLNLSWIQIKYIYKIKITSTNTTK
jgi:hypothetical protein